MKSNQKGFSLVELLIVVAIIGIIAAIAIPSLLAARKASNESAAIGSLRSLGSAEATWLSSRSSAGTMSVLKTSGLIDSAWAAGTVRSNYTYNEGANNTSSWMFKAEPDTSSSGSRSFNIIEDYVVRAQQATTTSSGAGTPIGT